MADPICRYCNTPAASTYCPSCGVRLAGDPFDTLSACLTPPGFVRELRSTVRVLPDGAEMREAEDNLIACEELDREILNCADRLRAGDERDIAGLMTRGRATELLDALPLDMPGLSDLRVAVWRLVSDLERWDERARLDREWDKLEQKAARHGFAMNHKRAVAAWQDCLFWLSRNQHPEGERLRKIAEAGLAENVAETA